MAFTAANGRTQIALADINISAGRCGFGSAHHLYGDRAGATVRH